MKHLTPQLLACAAVSNADLGARDVSGVVPSVIPVATVQIQPVYYSEYFAYNTVIDPFRDGNQLTISNAPLAVVVASAMTTTITSSTTVLCIATDPITLSSTQITTSTGSSVLTTPPFPSSGSTTVSTAVQSTSAILSPSAATISASSSTANLFIGQGLPTQSVDSLPDSQFILLGFSNLPTPTPGIPVKRAERVRRQETATASPVTLVDLSTPTDLPGGVDQDQCDLSSPLLLRAGSLVQFGDAVGKQTGSSDAILGFLTTVAAAEVNISFSLTAGVLSWNAPDAGAAVFFDCAGSITAVFDGSIPAVDCVQVVIGAVAGQACIDRVSQTRTPIPTFTAPIAVSSSTSVSNATPGSSTLSSTSQSSILSSSSEATTVSSPTPNVSTSDTESASSSTSESESTSTSVAPPSSSIIDTTSSTIVESTSETISTTVTGFFNSTSTTASIAASSTTEQTSSASTWTTTSFVSTSSTLTTTSSVSSAANGTSETTVPSSTPATSTDLNVTTSLTQSSTFTIDDNTAISTTGVTSYSNTTAPLSTTSSSISLSSSLAITTTAASSTTQGSSLVSTTTSAVASSTTAAAIPCTSGSEPGISYAVEPNPFPRNAYGLPNLDPTYFYDAVILANGTTSVIGPTYTGPSAGTGIAVNHRAFLNARIAGNYTFTVPAGQDDLTLVWIGTVAFSTYTRSNAVIDSQITGGQQSLYTLEVATAGILIPFRVLAANANGGFGYSLLITDPLGVTVLSPIVPGLDNIYQQCDTVGSPNFFPFGAGEGRFPAATTSTTASPTSSTTDSSSSTTILATTTDTPSTTTSASTTASPAPTGPCANITGTYAIQASGTGDFAIDGNYAILQSAFGSGYRVTFSANAQNAQLFKFGADCTLQTSDGNLLSMTGGTANLHYVYFFPSIATASALINVNWEVLVCAKNADDTLSCTSQSQSIFQFTQGDPLLQLGDQNYGEEATLNLVLRV